MSSSAFEVVRITTGMRLRSTSSLISARTCRPSLMGRLRSSRIKSGRIVSLNLPCLRRQANASSPLVATIRLLRTLLSLSTSCVSRTSPALSSTSKISTGCDWDSKFILFSLLYFLHGCNGNRKTKCRPSPGGWLDPNVSAVPLDDLLADRQSDAGAGIFGLRMKPLKDHEDTVGVLLRDADAIITN